MSVEGFGVCVEQEVVLRDLDGFGHVNNAVFLTYVENARVAYLREVLGVRTLEQIRNVMASVKIDYLAQVSFGDRLEIGVRVDRIGTKSFQMAYRMRRGDGVLVAEATSVQVTVDADGDGAVEVPAEWRRAIEAHDDVS
jgi:acyl-CoA thioester hydrolase